LRRRACFRPHSGRPHGWCAHGDRLGTVVADVCHVLDPHRQPVLRYLTNERTAGWLMGMDWLVAGLEHFGI
jgi:hypothetical protein